MGCFKYIHGLVKKVIYGKDMHRKTCFFCFLFFFFKMHVKMNICIFRLQLRLQNWVHGKAIRSSYPR